MNYNLNKVKEATWEYVGGLENQLEDYEEGSEEYNDAKAFFDLSREEQIEDVYEAIVNYIEKEVRFAGKDTIKAYIAKYIG